MKAPLVVSAVLGASLTLGLFDGPLGLSFAYQSAPAAQAPAITVQLDRTRKGDRLPATGATATTIIEKITPADGKPNPRLAPVKLGDCEPLASPIVDAALSKLAGRCFV